MSSCNIITSRKGKVQLVVDGFIYCVNKVRDNVYYWHCIEKCNKTCNVWIKTIKHEDEHHVVSKKINVHTHLPQPELIQVRKLHKDLKDSAVSCGDRPSQIIQRCNYAIPSTSAPFMPNKSAMQAMIHRARNRDIPKLPVTLEDLVIPEEYQTINGNYFLIAHYCHEGEIVIIFATEQNLKLLAEAEFWIMDGTFRCSPKLVYQLYTIHAMVGDQESTHQILPLVYGLLSGKSEHCYFIFLELLKNNTYNRINLELNPRIIITDFEKAAINACKLSFPRSQHKCCFFHFVQIIWRRIERAGLSQRYSQDSQFAHKLRHITSLAYLPPDEILAAYQLIKENVLPKSAEVLLILFESFEQDFVIGTRKCVSKSSNRSKILIQNLPPRFPPQLWSISDSIACNVPTTQNACESWHSRWNILLNRKKMNIFKTITELKKEQRNTDNEITRIRAQIQKESYKRQKKHDERLKNHLQMKEEMETIEFLEGIAYIMYLKRK